MIATNSQFPRITSSDEEPSGDLLWRAVRALEMIAVDTREMKLTAKELCAYMCGHKRTAATESQALALLIELGPRIAEIAERLSVHRSTLYRWPKFMAAVSRVRTGGRGMRVISKDDEGDDE